MRGRETTWMRICCCCAAILLLCAGRQAVSQVITVNTKTGEVANSVEGQAPVDRRFQQIQPTQVQLPQQPMGASGRTSLFRALMAEQGFAMRPLPKGRKGLLLEANGKLQPAGEAYLNLIATQGMSVKPGDRVSITELKIEHSRIILDLNGGPDKKNRLLSHVQIGIGPRLSPVVRDDGQEPIGSRLTLAFKGDVPDLTAEQVKALLSPLLSFDVKTPIQAFTDTLPVKLKEAILNHQVMVGMTIEMVLYSKGRPEIKSREMDGQMPFEEWIYGKPPNPVEFVRINGNRVIRVEVARMGETPQIFSEDVVTALMQSRITTEEARSATHSIQMGDVHQDPDQQAPVPPPSLRKPGEASSGTELKPVRFPTPKPASGTQPGDNPDEESRPQ